LKGKHVEAKTIAHTIHNCNNILYSIAKNSQISTCYNLINNKLLNLEYDIISYQETTKLQLEDKSLFNNLECLQSNDKILINIKFKFFGQLFQSGMCIVIKSNDSENLVKFAKIKDIIMYTSKIHFFCQILKAEFDTHYHAFIVDETNEYVLRDTDELHNYHSLSLIKSLKMGESKSFLRPHSLICNYF
jgi:transcriptional regulator of heat shock response